MRGLVALARRPRSRRSVSSHGAHAETAVGRARIGERRWFVLETLDVDRRFFVFLEENAVERPNFGQTWGLIVRPNSAGTDP